MTSNFQQSPLPGPQGDRMESNKQSGNPNSHGPSFGMLPNQGQVQVQQVIRLTGGQEFISGAPNLQFPVSYPSTQAMYIYGNESYNNRGQFPKDPEKSDIAGIQLPPRPLSNPNLPLNPSPKTFNNFSIPDRNKNDKMLSNYDRSGLNLNEDKGLSPLSIVTVPSYQDGGHPSPSNISNNNITNHQQALRYQPSGDAMLSAINYNENEMLHEGGFDVSVSGNLGELEDGLLGSGIGVGTAGTMRLPETTSNSTFDLFDGDGQDAYMETNQDLQLSPQSFSDASNTFNMNENSNMSNVTDPETQGNRDDGNKRGDSGVLGSNANDKPRSKSRPNKTTSPIQQCPVCGKTFGSSSALAKHKLTHSDERKFICQLCTKAFKRQDHLNGHMMTHLNKKPYECKVENCGKGYCDGRSLRRHIENHHQGNTSTATTSAVTTVTVIPSHMNLPQEAIPFSEEKVRLEGGTFNESPLGNRIQYAPPPPPPYSPSQVNSLPNTTSANPQLPFLAYHSQETTRLGDNNIMQWHNSQFYMGQAIGLYADHNQEGRNERFLIPGNPLIQSGPHTTDAMTVTRETHHVAHHAQSGQQGQQGQSSIMQQQQSALVQHRPWTRVPFPLPNPGFGNSDNPKPVECSICHRRFKNIPALNGHMRLHGGYFKKDGDGNSHKKHEKKTEESTQQPSSNSTEEKTAEPEKPIRIKKEELPNSQPQQPPLASVNFTALKLAFSHEAKSNHNEQIPDQQMQESKQHQVSDSDQTHDKTVCLDNNITSPSQMQQSHPHASPQQPQSQVSPMDSENMVQQNIDSTSNVFNSPVLNVDLSKQHQLQQQIQQQQELQQLHQQQQQLEQQIQHQQQLQQQLQQQHQLQLQQLQHHQLQQQQHLQQQQLQQHQQQYQLQHFQVLPHPDMQLQQQQQQVHINQRQTIESNLPQLKKEIDELREPPFFPSQSSGNEKIRRHSDSDKFVPPKRPTSLAELLRAKIAGHSNLHNNTNNNVTSLNPINTVMTSQVPNVVESNKLSLPPPPKCRTEEFNLNAKLKIRTEETSPLLLSRPKLQSRSSEDHHDDDVFLNPSSLPTSPMRVKRKHRPEPLYIPPHVNTSGFQSRLRSPRLWEGAEGKNCSPPPYTPPPMLSPVRSGSGLFWHIINSSGSLTPKSAPITPRFGIMSRRSSIGEVETDVEDEIGEPIETDIQPHVNIGPQFQATLPSYNPFKRQALEVECKEDLVFDPKLMEDVTDEDLEVFTDFACCAAVPGGGRNKEYALHLLHLTKGNIKEAILLLMSSEMKLPKGSTLLTYQYSESDRWSPEEIESYHQALSKCDKDFFNIAQEVGTKSVKDCVQFYYLWKKVCPDEYKRLRIIRRRKEQEDIYYNLRSKAPNDADSESESTHTPRSTEDWSLTPKEKISHAEQSCFLYYPTNDKDLEIASASFTCEYPDCIASFTSRQALNGHVRVHGGNTTAKGVNSCSSVPTSYKSQSNEGIDKKSQGSGPPSNVSASSGDLEEFPCKTCGKIFNKVKSRSAHMKSHRQIDAEKKIKTEIVTVTPTVA